MSVTFLWITASDYVITRNRYGSNVQLFRDKEGVHLKVVWCANEQYIGRVLKKKHDRTVCSGAFDSVVSLLEKAECRLKLVSVT